MIVAGLACGFLNTLASSGSAVSLPILMMLGVPESAANATNRLPVLFGALMATATFAREGKIDWKAAAAAPACCPLQSRAPLWVRSWPSMWAIA